MELQMKKEEIQYSIKTRKFIKKTFVDKVPNELILEIIKYVGFNEIQLNTYNMLYNYYNYYNYGSYSNLQVVNILMKNNFNREWETSLT
jgi:hypothetical protein